jgi:3-hydroxyisobutyrate dehydrogenase-like beta-hydroxyacid dehydrogenase
VDFYDRSVTRVGLLFPGEMGAAVGGAADVDVLWASEGRSAETRARAEAAGLRDVGTTARLVAESELVLSVCPPEIAEDVAGEVAGLGFEGLFVEANAISPARAERIARETGLRMVDGSLLGNRRISFYLSGEDAEVARVAELFVDSDVVAIPLPGGIGAASALKMAFGGWNKIGVLLAAQAYAIARAYGVDEALGEEGVPAGPIPRAGPKAWRWRAEMEEVAATCEALGLPPGLGLAAAEVCLRWEEQKGRRPELDELLDALRVTP